MSCTKCGAAFPSPTAKFCLKCGAKAPGAAAGATPTTSSTTPSSSSSYSAPASNTATTNAVHPPSPARAPTSPVSAPPKRADGRHCTACQGIIVGETVEVGEGKPGFYHPACFACSSCRAPITAAYTLDPDENILCQSCADKTLQIEASECGACGKDIIGQTIVTQGHKYHPACFVCAKCRADLNTTPFLPGQSGLQCKNCVLTERGDICVVCSKVIDKGGIKALEKRYHPDCFNCTSCRANLAATGKFVAGSSGPICPDCSRAQAAASAPPAHPPSSTSSSSSAAGGDRPKFCGECGTSLNAAVKFCSECGHKVAA